MYVERIERRCCAIKTGRSGRLKDYCGRGEGFLGLL